MERVSARFATRSAMRGALWLVLMAGLATASPATTAGPVVARVAVAGFELSDNGDHDGRADAHETVAMRLRVRNLLDRRVDDLVARLTTADPTVECVSRSWLFIGSLAAGEERITDQAFEFKIASIERGIVAEDLSAAFTVRVISDELGHALVADQPLVLDLDLDATGGSGSTVFFESFENGFGAFTTMHLDESLNPPTSDLSNHAAGVINADGYRCAYSDPEWEASNSYGNSQGEQCFPGPNGLDDEFFFRIDDERSFSGSASLHYGVRIDNALGYTTPASQLEALRTTEPIALARDRHCSLNPASTCDADVDCPVGESCVDPAPVLSFKHQANFVDSRTTGGQGFGGSADKAVVHVQAVDGGGNPGGPWVKAAPFVNNYDSQPTYNYFNCSFDPTDDGNTEEDFFDPTDPIRSLGPSSTCYPEFNFSYQGDTGSFHPGATGEATHGPALAGESGAGTWIESQVSLDRYRGRRVRLRFLVSGIKLHGFRTWEELFHINPYEGDDGWFIDDVVVTHVLSSPADVSVDENDNAMLPPLFDDDNDGLACDNCPLVANQDQTDADGDGIGDACDACPGDPINDGDGDGQCCADDNCCSAYNPSQTDTDGDGVGDACDNCIETPNADQADANANDIGDLCDDADGDGVVDALDICPSTFDPAQADADRDVVGDLCDNCPGIRNPSQDDEDLDSVGDFCDPCPLHASTADTDADGVPDACDNCPLVPNPDQRDLDRDGVADACDNCPRVDNDRQLDYDADGVGNLCDTCRDGPDTDEDADGIPCGLDNCPDISNPDQTDFDGDGLGDACDACFADAEGDPDGDGICARQDSCPALFNLGGSSAVRVSGTGRWYSFGGGYDVTGDGTRIVYAANGGLFDVSLESLEIRHLAPRWRRQWFQFVGVDPSGDRAYATIVPFMDRKWRLVGVDLQAGSAYEANRALSPSGIARTRFRFPTDGSVVVHRTQEGVSCVSSPADCFTELFANPAAGGNAVRLHPSLEPNGRIFSTFEISHDGRHVVFVGDLRTLGKPELYRVSIDGGPTVRLNHDLAAGQTIAGFALGAGIVAYRVDRTGLYARPLLGGAPVLLADSSVRSHRVTADGQRVVFSVGDTLFSVPAGGGPVEPLTPAGAESSDWQLAPGDSHVVVIADADSDGRSELFSVPVTGGPLTRLSAPDPPAFADVSEFAISPDGNSFLYTADYTTDDVPELFHVSVQGGEPTPISGPLMQFESVRDPSFGPDGSTVVFVANLRREESNSGFEVFSSSIYVARLEPDPDGDGILELCDTCPGVFDPHQLDADADGFGAACDCSDDDSAVHPGAAEVNDGLDNQCPGEAGFGQIDEVAGVSGFAGPDKNEYSWPAQSSVTLYEVAVASAPQFTTCERVATSETFWIDPETPAPSGVRYYLVRAAAPFAGSWGAGSEGTERAVACP